MQQHSFAAGSGQRLRHILALEGQIQSLQGFESLEKKQDRRPLVHSKYDEIQKRKSAGGKEGVQNLKGQLLYRA